MGGQTCTTYRPSGRIVRASLTELQGRLDEHTDELDRLLVAVRPHVRPNTPQQLFLQTVGAKVNRNSSWTGHFDTDGGGNVCVCARACVRACVRVCVCVCVCDCVHVYV